MKRFSLGILGIAVMAAVLISFESPAFAQSGTVKLECRPGECSPAWRTLEGRFSDYRLISSPTVVPAPPSAVDLRPLLNEVVLPLGTAIAVWLAGWITTRLAGFLKISRDDRVRAYLEKALLLAIDYGRSRLDRGTPITVQVKSQIVADAANFAILHVPGALKHFGVDQDGLKRMLAARLESTTATEPPKAE